MFPQTNFNLPTVKRGSEYKPLVNPSNVNGFFGNLASGIKSLFTPTPANMSVMPTNPLSGLGQGYKPLTLNGGIPVPPASAFNVGLPNPQVPTVQAQPVVQPTVSQNAPVQQPKPIQVAQPQPLAVSAPQLPIYNPNPPIPSPTSFGTNPVTTDGYIPSNLMGSNTTYRDVLAKRDSLEKQYMDALNSSVDIKTRGLQAIEDARYSGETSPFAQGTTERVQRNADLATLAATSRADAIGKMLGINQQDVTNTLNAQVTNQGLQTSATGEVFAQTRDPLTGSTKLVSYGNIYNGTFTGQPVSGVPMSGSGNVTQMGTALPNAGGVSSNVSVPTQLQGAVFTAPNGQAYVAQDKLTKGLETAQTILAKQAGIPVLSESEVAAVRNVDYVKQQIGGIQGIIGNILSSGTTGRIKDMLVNPIKDFLQTDTNISTFNAYRETAINTIQSLAGGAGSGLRLTSGEIAQASANIPEITDNLETANAKLAKLNTFLDNKMATLLPPQAQQSQPTGTVVQTKVGAINTDW